MALTDGSRAGILGRREVVVVAKVKPDASALGQESDRTAADVERRNIASTREHRRDISPRDAQDTNSTRHERAKSVFSPLPRRGQHRVTHHRDRVALSDERRMSKGFIVFKKSRRPDKHAFDAENSGTEERDRPAKVPMNF